MVIDKPERFAYSRDGTVITISWRRVDRSEWWSSIVTGLIFLVVLAVVIVGAASDPELVAVAVFATVFFLLYCWSLLWSLRLETRLRIRQGQLSVERRSLLGYRHASVFVAGTVRQVYALGMTSARTSLRIGGPLRRFYVKIVTTDGEDGLLFFDALPMEEALFLEQEIENGLGVDDRVVQGAMPRSAPLEPTKRELIRTASFRRRNLRRHSQVTRKGWHPNRAA